MYGTDAVQVVLGEGDTLRGILEVEGFQVVGHARGDAELRRVLDVTHPSVIVLDAGISVPAAIDARTRAVGARLVVIWPDAVRTGSPTNAWIRRPSSTTLGTRFEGRRASQSRVRR